MDARTEELVQQYDPASPDFDVYREMRSHCPVARTSHGWLLTRYEDVLHVAHDDDHFPTGPAIGYPSGIPEDELLNGPTRTPMSIPIMLDPPAFWKYRRLLTPQFSPAKAREREGDIRGIATTLVDAFIERGTVDLHADLAVPLPAILTCRLLGVPEEEWEFYATPVHYMLHQARPKGDNLPGGYDGGSALDWDLLFPVVEAMIAIAEKRRSNPQDDLLSFLATVEVDGEQLTPYEIGGIATLVVIGGVDTTTGVLGSAFVHMGRNPDVRQRLIDDPALIPLAVEEYLRAFSPVQRLPRMAAEPSTIGEAEVAAGDMVMLCWAAANRDPEQFPDPDEIHVDRHPNRHMAFGVGIHRCLGSNLARLEFQVALEEVLGRLPDYRLDEDRVHLQPNAQIYGYSEVGATFTPGSRRA